MPHRLEIGLKRGVPDSRGRRVQLQMREYFHLPVRGCDTRDIYKIDVDLAPRQLSRVRRAFTDPVVARCAEGRLPPPPRFDWLIEVGFKPGVTDNVGRTAQVVLQDLLERPLLPEERVYTAVQYFIRGSNLSRADADRIATELLGNPLIHDISVFAPSAWNTRENDISVPAIHGEGDLEVETYDLSGCEGDLMRISREGILSLSLIEMQAIRDHFRLPAVQQTRAELGLPEQPTDVEVEAIAQTWSEHCKHKIFAARVHYVDEAGQEEWIDSLFNTYIKGSTAEIAKKVDWLVSVFTDNAGIIAFNDQYHLAFKVETHNSPSALEPYGGAITGIVGCNRDPMGTGMGCELLFNTWGYCLGSPFYTDDIPAGLLHPRRVREGVHHGVIDGGNQSGIPWVRGFEFFESRYLGKPLVYCGTVGRIPVLVGGRPSERKEIEPGDQIVMVGGRIGKDGIHGATFSSEEIAHRKSRSSRSNWGPSYAAQDVRISYRSSRRRALPRPHRQRSRWTQLIHRRDGHPQWRGRTRSSRCTPEIRGSPTLGNSSFRSPRTHVAGCITRYYPILFLIWPVAAMSMPPLSVPLPTTTPSCFDTGTA